MKEGLPNSCSVHASGRVCYSARRHAARTRRRSPRICDGCTNTQAYSLTRSLARARVRAQPTQSTGPKRLAALIAVPLQLCFLLFTFRRLTHSKQNSIIIALFNVKVPYARVAGVELQQPRRLQVRPRAPPNPPLPGCFVSWARAKSSSPRTPAVIHLYSPTPPPPLRDAGPFCLSPSLPLP